MPNEPTSSLLQKRGSIDVVDFLANLWTKRRLVLAIVGVATALAIVISALMSNYYKSTATLLPETERSKLSALGNLSDLASLAGINPGEVSLVKLYPRIIVSEAVLKNVLSSKYYSEKFNDSVTLVRFWGLEQKTPELTYERALAVLRDQLDVAMDVKTSIVSISIETRDARVSADIVNKVASELDKFIRTKRTTNATEQRKWIEARLQEVKKDLENAENGLRDFREKNRRVLDSPELLLEQERMVREVQINSALYTELKKQYELIKIEEIKNIPIITVMDAGRPAALKERPKRGILVITVFMLSFIGAAAYVFVSSQYELRLVSFLQQIGIRSR